MAEIYSKAHCVVSWLGMKPTSIVSVFPTYFLRVKSAVSIVDRIAGSNDRKQMLRQASKTSGLDWKDDVLPKWLIYANKNIGNGSGLCQKCFVRRTFESYTRALS